MTSELRLEKYQALGNDFLVLVDTDGSRPVGAALARALCDRHRGVGADGLIRVTRNSAEPGHAMELYNADGGRAEMSGNGIRCLARALADAGLERRLRFSIATDAGPREVSLGEDGTVTVDMGTPRFLPMQASGRDRAESAVSLGNPHVVVAVEDVVKVDLEAEAALWGEATNVEVAAAGPEPDSVAMRVHERGVGETLACGTGACATAFAASGWGWVGPQVVVHQPGGDLFVDLSGPSVELRGPAVRVATVIVDRSALANGEVVAWP